MSDTYIDTRKYLDKWRLECSKNFYDQDIDFQHSLSYYFSKDHKHLHNELTLYATDLAKIEPLVIENHYRSNYPRLDKYDGFGNRIEHVCHHPNYETIGNTIYGSSKMLKRLAKFGGLQESLAFFFLSSHLGEAGHNCPFACSAGIIRVLQKVDNVPNNELYIQKLTEPLYTNNYTGAQFLTEIQGGSDVGQNATQAFQDKEGNWRIRGEKWFCSNANADLILMTARFNPELPGTKGLGLFLVPKYLEKDQHNHYSILRLKEKIGTNAMASGEIEFQDTIAYPVGKLEDGFKLVMENVLHISRLCNSICVLGMARRALKIATSYAKYRIAFGHPILHYPLVQENLAITRAENNAGLAATMATIQLQDLYDTDNLGNQDKKSAALLLRLFANLCKYYTALYSVEHIHHSIDILAGNGAIETFSILPRLLRDSVVCENWEGTHNTLRMQISRDILKFNIDTIFIEYINHELNLLNNDKAHQERIQALEHSITQLISELSKFRNNSLKIQSLQIKAIVEQMSTILAAIMLLKEAIHQAATTKNSRKLNSFDLFCFKHIIPGDKHLNEEYLELIDKLAN